MHQRSPQEFYGLDDECVLLTTNYDGMNEDGHAVALEPAAAPANVWAAGFTDGNVYKVDGRTGALLDARTLLANCFTDGMAIDAQGIGWSVA